MPHAFVTGGTGFVGRNLVEQLTEQGWEVTVLHRPTSDVEALEVYGVNLAVGELLEPDSLRRALPPQVDAVFHVAGNTSVWSRNNARQSRDNVEGTRNMVDAALAAGARRFVYTSTWNTYGLEAYATITEDTPQLGLNSWINYNRSKALAEQLVKEAVSRGLDAVVMNPSHIIGRYDPGNWSRLIRLVHQRRLPGVPPGSGSFCHAEQVALAHIAAAQQGETGANYLLGGTDASFLEVIRVIGELTGRKVPRRPVPVAVLKIMARLQAARALFTGREPDLTPEAAAMLAAHPRVVSDKAERELGYEKVPLRVMLEDCYTWMRAEALL